MPNEYLPWLRLLKASYGALHLTPDVFWDMTPPEWMAAMAGSNIEYESFCVAAVPPLTRKELDLLSRQFPDIAIIANASEEIVGKAC